MHVNVSIIERKAFDSCRTRIEILSFSQNRKVDGTTVISFVLRPENGMEVVVDCVGILKERNVDVEHKLQKLKGRTTAQVKGNSNITDSGTGGVIHGQIIPGLTKKRSTRARMVFKCDLPELRESLTAISQPFLCTQPTGCPEVGLLPNMYYN